MHRRRCTRSACLHRVAPSVENQIAEELPAFDGERDALSAADAECGEAALHVATLHLVNEGHEHAAAGGADGMAERDRAAIDVDLRDVELQFLRDGQRLRGEGFIRFDQIHRAERPAGLLQAALCGGDRTFAHVGGIDAGAGIRNNFREHGQAELRSRARPTS